MQHYAYSSFGKLIKISNSSSDDITAAPIVKTSYGFTNRELDQESGMMYYRARYYMPEIGRFIQEDPYAGELAQPASVISKYIYVANNPANLKDPKGKFWVTIAYAFLTALATTSVDYLLDPEKDGIDGAFWNQVGQSFLFNLVAASFFPTTFGGPDAFGTSFATGIGKAAGFKAVGKLIDIESRKSDQEKGNTLGFIATVAIILSMSPEAVSEAKTFGSDAWNDLMIDIGKEEHIWVPSDYAYYLID